MEIGRARTHLLAEAEEGDDDPADRGDRQHRDDDVLRGEGEHDEREPCGDAEADVETRE